MAYRLTEFLPSTRYQADITHLTDAGGVTYFLSAGRLWGGWWSETPAGVITAIAAQSAAPLAKQVHIPGVADNLVVAHDENISGWIVGSFTQGLVTHGFLANEKTGVVEQVDVKGATSTFLTAINKPGELAGAFVDRQAHYHAFLADPHQQPVLGVALPDSLQVRLLVAAHA